MEVQLPGSIHIELEAGPLSSLPSDAQRALMSAELVLSTDSPHLDYGLAVVGYFKAMEILLYDRIFEQFRNRILSEKESSTTAKPDVYRDVMVERRNQAVQVIQSSIYDSSIQFQDRLTLLEDNIKSFQRIEEEHDHLQRLDNYVFQEKPLTLVDMAQILQYLKRVGDENRFGLLWPLKRFIKQYYTRGYRLWGAKGQLAIKIEALTLADRNPAAHVKVYSREKALGVRGQILGDRSQHGILIRVLKALA